MLHDSAPGDPGDSVPVDPGTRASVADAAHDDVQTTLAEDAAEFQRVLSRLIRIYMFRDRDRVGSHDVTAVGAHALDVLVRLGGIGLNQLATELFVDKSTASRLVASLEERGYISRTTRREDRREVRLEVTPSGQELHQRIEAEALRDVKQLLRPFTVDARQGMTARLRHVARTFAIYAGVPDASVGLLPQGDQSIPFGAELRVAGLPDQPEALALLEAADLPTEGVDGHFLGTFVVARHPEDGALIGLAGVEAHGAAGLLRSLVVHPSFRNAGLGRALLLAVMNLAKTVGIRELYMVAAIARDALVRLGGEEVAREEVPAGIQRSAVLRAALATAPVLRFRLS